MAAVLAVFLAAALAALAVFKFLAVLAVFLAAALAAALLYSNLSMCTEKYGRPARPAVDTCHALCHAPVDGVHGGRPVAETMGTDVTRRAESIFDGPRQPSVASRP